MYRKPELVLQHLARGLDGGHKVETPVLEALGETDRVIVCRTAARILYVSLEADEDTQQRLLQAGRGCWKPLIQFYVYYRYGR